MSQTWQVLWVSVLLELPADLSEGRRATWANRDMLFHTGSLLTFTKSLSRVSKICPSLRRSRCSHSTEEEGGVEREQSLRVNLGLSVPTAFYWPLLTLGSAYLWAVGGVFSASLMLLFPLMSLWSKQLRKELACLWSQS